MAFQKPLCFLMALLITFICSSHAYTFQVGGKDGWTLHPSESYNNWAGRSRFSINDTLHFKYDGGSDSVLVVNKGDYDGCNIDKPIMKLDGGDSTFKFDRSGPFYFITGNKSNCDQGQKLIAVVLALRNKSPPPPSTTMPPSPSTLPPTPAVSPTLPPSPSTISPVSPSPISPAPVSPPSAADSPESSPSPISPSPVSPSPPTAADSPESSPTGTPVLTPPASSPGGGGGSSPGGATGSGQSPRGNNPAADVNTPPSPSAATPSLSGTIIASFVTIIVASWSFN